MVQNVMVQCVGEGSRVDQLLRVERVLHGAVRGELSDLVTREIADRMQKRAPSLQRVDIPCTGHAPMLTEPAAIAALAGFLEKAP